MLIRAPGLLGHICGPCHAGTVYGGNLGGCTVAGLALARASEWGHPAVHAWSSRTGVLAAGEKTADDAEEYGTDTVSVPA